MKRFYVYKPDEEIVIGVKMIFGIGNGRDC